jgi:hypothetical protein
LLPKSGSGDSGFQLVCEDDSSRLSHMPRSPKADPDRITKLEQQRARIDRALRQARDAEKQQARADDARRKIIQGALDESHALQNPRSEFAKIHVRLLVQHARLEDRHLLADIFRALLPARDAEALLAEGEAARQAAQAAKKKPANTDTAPARRLDAEGKERLPEVAE